MRKGNRKVTLAAPEQGRKVAVALMQSDIANATVDALTADYPEVVVIEHGTYVLLEADDELRIEMSRVGEELGAPITLGQWLVIMVTFVGRAAPGGDYMRVTSQMIDIASDAV